MLEIFGTLTALYLLLAVAFPDRFIPASRAKSKKVGSTYWGAYEGTACQEPEELKKIDTPHPARKERNVAGSQMYAMGRGTSFRN